MNIDRQSLNRRLLVPGAVLAMLLVSGPLQAAAASSQEVQQVKQQVSSIKSEVELNLRNLSNELAKLRKQQQQQEQLIQSLQRQISQSDSKFGPVDRRLVEAETQIQDNRMQVVKAMARANQALNKAGHSDISSEQLAKQDQRMARMEQRYDRLVARLKQFIDGFTP